MLFENLAIKRIVLHEVFQRLSDKQVVKPAYGNELAQLSDEAVEVFRSRVIDALGNSSQSMEMTIRDVDATSAIALAAALDPAADEDFVSISCGLANKLAVAQTSRSWPGGILIVFDGTIGNPSKNFIGVLKAETHSGFRREYQQGEMLVTFFKDLFLSPQTKLYKIGMFIKVEDASMELPTGWRAIVYDSNMSNANRQGAAQYFYETFLGCTIPLNSAHLTRQFFEDTREFIGKLSLDQEIKSDLLTSLYTYLKVDTSPTIQVSTFSDAYLASEMRDDYSKFMAQRNFPLNAVQKDISDLKNSLRQRKLSFGGTLKLTGSPEDFQTLVSLETVREGPDKQTVDWTRITIRDHVRRQE